MRALAGSSTSPLRRAGEICRVALRRSSSERARRSTRGRSAGSLEWGDMEHAGLGRFGWSPSSTMATSQSLSGFAVPRAREPNRMAARACGQSWRVFRQAETSSCSVMAAGIGGTVAVIAGSARIARNTTGRCGGGFSLSRSAGTCLRPGLPVGQFGIWREWIASARSWASAKNGARGRAMGSVRGWEAGSTLSCSISSSRSTTEPKRNTGVSSTPTSEQAAPVRHATIGTPGR